LEEREKPRDAPGLLSLGALLVRARLMVATIVSIATSSAAAINTARMIATMKRIRFFAGVSEETSNGRMGFQRVG
jgi:hypothetical protein